MLCLSGGGLVFRVRSYSLSPYLLANRRKGSTTPVFGQRLLARLLSSNNGGDDDDEKRFEDSCVATYAVLLEELHGSEEKERWARLDLSIAAYVSLCRVVGEKG
jgi:hypothetical protein